MSAPRTEAQQLGPYRLIERIGEGGMGVVHLAVGPSGDLVAVKMLRPWLVAGHDGRSRFEREVAALQKVRGPRVAEVVDADLRGDPPYVVTRYIRGNPLEKVVADHGPLRGEALIALASGLAEAIATVHAAGVVHRDIKPGNVLLPDEGPVLIDFGLARALDETRLTATGVVIGTPRYLAPEVVAGSAPSPATDIHGWAATVAFAATGRPPYGSGPDAVVLDRIRRGEFDLAGVDAAMASLLTRALAADPAYRPGLGEIRRRLDTPEPDATTVVAPSPPTAIVPPSGPPTRVDHAPVAPMPRPPVQPRQQHPVGPGPGTQQPVAPQAGVQRPAQRLEQRPPTAPPAGYRAGPDGVAQPLRTWPARLAVAAGGLAVLVLFAIDPPAGLTVLFVVMVAARTAWRVRRSLYERRIARGHQPSDHWVMAAGAPWHLLVTSLQSAFHLVWIALAAYLVGAGASLGERPGPRLPFLAGATVALVLAWLGPGTGRIRNGVRALTAPLDRSPRAAWITFGVLIAMIWIFLLIWEGVGVGWPLLEELQDGINDLLNLTLL